MLGPAEHQMLEEMREARAAGRFVLRPNVIPGRDCDDRRLVIFMDDDLEAVLQREGRIGDRHLLHELRHGHALRQVGGE